MLDFMVCLMVNLYGERRNHFFKLTTKDPINLGYLKAPTKPCFVGVLKEEDWYLDSGCSKHMTGDKSKFSFLTPKAKGFVTYGDNNQGRILGVGKNMELITISLLLELPNKMGLLRGKIDP